MDVARNKRILDALERKARESHSAAERAAFAKKAGEVTARLRAAGIKAAPPRPTPKPEPWPTPERDRAPPRNDGHRHGKAPPDPLHEPTPIEDFTYIIAAAAWGLMRLARAVPFMVWPCALVLFAPPLSHRLGVDVVSLIVIIAGFGVIAGSARGRLKERGLAD